LSDINTKRKNRVRSENGRNIGNRGRSQERIVKEAAMAVSVREETGTVRESPILWAAVTTLTDFIRTQEGLPGKEQDVPRDVLLAVTRLTAFLNKADLEPQQEEDIASMEAVIQFTRRRQQAEVTRTTQPTTTVKTQSPILPTRRPTASNQDLRPVSKSTTIHSSSVTTESALATRDPPPVTIRAPLDTIRRLLATTKFPPLTTSLSLATTHPPSTQPHRRRTTTKRSFTRPPPPSYFTETVPEQLSDPATTTPEQTFTDTIQDQEEERRKFFAEKYLESDLIRGQNGKGEQRETPRSSFVEEDEYSGVYKSPNVEFKFKFNTDTGVFSANTDLLVNINKLKERKRRPVVSEIPEIPPSVSQANRPFKIYTLPT